MAEQAQNDKQDDQQDNQNGEQDDKPRPARARASRPRKTAAKPAKPARGGWDVAMEAARQLQQLTGNEVEAITGLRRTDDGWRVQVDVLELRRVPTTTDVIATYDVDVDGSGDLMGYHRQHRFVRGEVGDDR